MRGWAPCASLSVMRVGLAFGCISPACGFVGFPVVFAVRPGLAYSSAPYLFPATSVTPSSPSYHIIIGVNCCTRKWCTVVSGCTIILYSVRLTPAVLHFACLRRTLGVYSGRLMSLPRFGRAAVASRIRGIADPALRVVMHLHYGVLEYYETRS